MINVPRAINKTKSSACSRPIQSCGLISRLHIPAAEFLKFYFFFFKDWVTRCLVRFPFSRRTKFNVFLSFSMYISTVPLISKVLHFDDRFFFFKKNLQFCDIFFFFEITWKINGGLISKNLKGKFSNHVGGGGGTVARESEISRKRRIEFSCPFSLSRENVSTI